MTESLFNSQCQAACNQVFQPELPCRYGRARVDIEEPSCRLPSTHAE